MSESKNLTKHVEKINAELRGYGRAAVQEIKMMKDRSAWHIWIARHRPVF
ncbi:MAG: hypothetical protein WBB23_22995 [Desulforhopalus sp.]